LKVMPGVGTVLEHRVAAHTKVIAKGRIPVLL
jgi:hypothetical protein